MDRLAKMKPEPRKPLAKKAAPQMNTYIHVRWLHEFADEPIDLWTEIDADRYEVRKLEFFRDGRVGYAGPEGDALGTRLGIEPIPPLNEIVADRQFVPEEVAKEAFEERWSTRR